MVGSELGLPARYAPWPVRCLVRVRVRVTVRVKVRLGLGLGLGFGLGLGLGLGLGSCSVPSRPPSPKTRLNVSEASG